MLNLRKLISTALAVALASVFIAGCANEPTGTSMVKECDVMTEMAKCSEAGGTE